MTGECTLTRAADVSVELSGFTLIVRASGVEVPDGRQADVQLVTEGVETILRLVTCPGEGDRGTVVRRFGLATLPQHVVVEHLDGARQFDFSVGAAAPDDGGALRGGGAQRVPVPQSSAPPPMPAPPPAPSASGRRWLRRAPQISFEWFKERLPRVGVPPRDERTPAPPPVPDFAETTDDDAPAAIGGGGVGGDVGHLTSGGEPDRPSLYARIDTADRFVVGEPQQVMLGLSPQPSVHLFTAPFDVPDSVGDRYILSMRLLADGFRRADGQDVWLFELAVTPQQPYPTVSVTLVADAIDPDLQLRRLSVVYEITGQTVGIAERPVAVVARNETAAPPPELPGYAARQAMAIPVSDQPADLTVVILHDPDGERGRLLWAMTCPHEGVRLPVHDLASDIGSSPEEFAHALRIQIEKTESTPGQPLLRELMQEIGSRIANEVPSEFWAALAEVQKAVGERAPSVLLLSQEPYVPWELALVPAHRDASAPPFLGAQAVVGRWVFGQDKPKMPPPEAVAMSRMAVVYGEYAGNSQLAEAIAEKTALESSLQALPVRATLPAMQELLRGQPPGEVLHFAIHGRFATGATGGLLMEDGHTLAALQVGGARLSAAPLVFLNACQVGAGAGLLGDYAGMAEAFLRAGASAVIAPLWSVRDGPAKDIALSFYEQALGGALPADILRRERASFGTEGNPSTATHLAYLFYGHPSFRLTRA